MCASCRTSSLLCGPPPFCNTHTWYLAANQMCRGRSLEKPLLSHDHCQSVTLVFKKRPSKNFDFAQLQPSILFHQGTERLLAALAACQNGSNSPARCGATRLGRRTRAQRNRFRRRRRAFLWGARCASGPPGLLLAEFHDDRQTNGSVHEYQCPIGFTSPKDNEIHTENVPPYAQRDLTLCQRRVFELGEMQWCTDRNESRTAFCQQHVFHASQ